MLADAAQGDETRRVCTGRDGESSTVDAPIGRISQEHRLPIVNVPTDELTDGSRLKG